MTRINSGVNIDKLVNAHAFAEWRELPRIASVIADNKAIMNNIPEKFTLGTGHVKFFYNKIKYLHDRYLMLTESCFQRGYNLDKNIINRNIQNFEFIKLNMKHLYNDYNDTNDFDILKQRIIERLKTMNNLKHFYEDISIMQAIKLLD